MTVPSLRIACRLVVTTLAVVCCLGLSGKAFAQDAGLPAWERRPYQVRLSVAADPAALPPAVAETVREDLADLLWRTFGEHWDLEFAPPPAALNRSDARGLERLDPDDFPPPADPPTEENPNPVRPPDRWFVVTIAPAADVAGPAPADPEGWSVAAREWDGTRRVLGPVRRGTATGPAAATAIAGRLVRDLFHPEYLISPAPEGPNGPAPMNEVRVAARAATLPVRDPAVDPLAPGRLLSVFLRRFDRDGAFRETRETPYTFVELGGVLDEDDPTRVQSGQVVSALRTAVGRTRGRTQTLARPIHQDLPGTTLRLVARGTGGGRSDGRPLVGYRVKIADRRVLPSDLPPPKDGEDPPEPEPYPEPIGEVSDRGGRIEAPAAPPAMEGEERSPGLIWLHVYSGKAKLGALPYVAGATPDDLLELDDDALRLGLEGEYALLAGEMLEIVANRAVLTARAKKNAKAKDYEAAEARLKDLSKLPRAENFKRQIDALAAGVRAEALEKGDRLTAARAGKLAEKMGQLADAYLSGDPLAAAKAEVAELRTLAEEIEEQERRAANRRNRR